MPSIEPDRREHPVPHNSNQLLLTSPSIIMSLQSLRTLARPVATRSFATSATLLNSSTKAPTTTESNAGIVPDAPVRDVVTADLVSGAPRA